MSGPEASLNSLVERFRREAAVDLSAVYQLHLTGSERGDWYLRIADGKCSLLPGSAGEPDVTITMAAQDWVDLLAGRLDGYTAFFQGRIEVTGDLSLALRLQSAFGF